MKKTILSILVLYVSLFLSSCSKNGASNNNKSFEVSESMDCRFSPPRIVKFQTGELAIGFIDDQDNEINYTPKLNKWYGDNVLKYKIKSLNKVDFGFFLEVNYKKEFDSCQ
jgi:hypothetical protein